MKSVSIIVPAYLPSFEYTKYLNDALMSVKQQSYKNINLTVVFNGNINYTIQDVNCIVLPFKCSASVARNIGASFNSSSDYLCFLDADDLFLPTKIEKQIEVMEKENIDFCFTDANVIAADGNSLGHYPYINNVYEHVDIEKIIDRENILPTSSVMINTSVFFKCGMFAPTNEYLIKSNPIHHNGNNCVYEDYLLWKTAITKGYKFKKLPDRLISYRSGTSVPR